MMLRSNSLMQFRTHRAYFSSLAIIASLIAAFGWRAQAVSGKSPAAASPAQAQPCSFTLTTQNRSFPATGGTGVVMITASDPQCAWTARSNATWIRITSGASGSGTGSVTFTVAPTISARRGALVIAGRVLIVRQEFNPCPQPEFATLPIALPNGFGSVDAPDLLVRDFNQDGRADLLLTTFGAAANIALAASGGGYEAPVAVAPTIGGNIRVADFNGDQKPDLAGLSDGRLRVALNTTAAGGAVSFAAPVETTVDQSMSDLAVGDFNRDGAVDVVGTTFTGFPPNEQNAVVLPGAGAGNFGAPIVTRFATRPNTFSGLLTGDFNGDGSLDLAASSSRNQVIILRGNGAGGFTLVPALDGSQGPVQIPDQLAVGDFNGDRKSDLATLRNEAASGGNPGRREAAIHLADDSGGFRAPIRTAVVYDGYIGRILVEDFNGDGRQELVIANRGGVEIIGAAGEAPTGYFVGALKISFNPGAPILVATGDFNRDGLPDIFAPIPVNPQSANTSPTTFAVLVARPGGAFAAPRNAVLLSDTQNFSNVTLSGATDYNGDGILDLLLRATKTTGQELIVRFGGGQGGFASQTSFSIDQNTPSVFGVDLTRDGRPEIVQFQFAGLIVHLNDGAGRFSPLQPVSIGANARLLSSGDFNADGANDLLVTSDTTGPTLLAGNGQGALTAAPLNLPQTQANASFIAGDYNGDGALDLLTIVSPSIGLPMLATLLNDGQGNFAAPVNQNLIFPQPMLRAGDFNLDGRTDLILFSPAQGAAGVHVLLSRGAGRFGEMDGNDAIPVSYEMTAEVAQLTPGDFNGDGVFDLIVIRRNNANALLLTGAADGSFSAAPNPLLLQNPATLVSDFNEDGANDLLIPNAAGLSFNAGQPFTGAFIFNRGACFPQGSLASTSAASFRGLRLAGESIISAFGANLAAETRVADTLPLPTALGETSVRITDNAGAESPAPLFFVSPQQVNFQIPAGASAGTAVVSVLRSGAAVATGAIEIVSINPGLFSANATGQGVAAAVALRIRQDGSQSFEPVAEFDQAQNRFVARPIDPGPESDQVFLILFGTGIRNHTALANVTATIGGAAAEVQFAGAQGGFVGLDQVNLRLPRSLAGRGEVEIEISVDLKTANKVKVNVK